MQFQDTEVEFNKVIQTFKKVQIELNLEIKSSINLIKSSIKMLINMDFIEDRIPELEGVVDELNHPPR